MPPRRKRAIFDTSAFNAIADDEDCMSLAKGVSVAYKVGITETALSEIVADPNPSNRATRLDLLKLLVSSGTGINPFNWIIEAQAKSYLSDPANFDWNSTFVRCRALEDEIARQEIINSVSEETLAGQRAAEEQFEQLFREARPAFQEIFDSGKTPPPLHEVAEHLLSEGGAHLTIAANLIERAAGSRPDAAATKDFIDRCPPFHALLLALCFSQYERCIRGERMQSLGKAGRNDMFSSVYLPYCDVFVTNDKGQCKALKAVVKMLHGRTTIQSYNEFSNGLFLISSLSISAG